MTHEWNEKPQPAPEDLMAFADGELSPAHQEEVQQWLAAHPEALSEVEEHRRLGRLWQSAAPPEPPPEVWAATLARSSRASAPIAAEVPAAPNKDTCDA